MWKKGWSAALFGAVAALLLLTGCGSLKPETVKSEDAVVIEAAPESISALLPEVTALAQSYDEDAVLTEVEVVYQGSEAIQKEQGGISFTFYSLIADEQRATTTTVLYRMDKGEVYRVVCTESSQFFCQTKTTPISLAENAPVCASFAGLFDTVRADEGFHSKLSGTNIKLTFTYTADQVELSLL